MREDMPKLYISERQAQRMGFKAAKKKKLGNVDKHYREKCDICKHTIQVNQSKTSIPVYNDYGVVTKIRKLHYRCWMEEGR